MKFINKKFDIFPKGKSKYKWPIIIALFAVIVSLELYTESLNGATWTTRLYIIFIIFLIITVGLTEED